MERTALYCKGCLKYGHVPKVCITTLIQKKNSHLGKEIKQITECYDTSMPYLAYGINLLSLHYEDWIPVHLVESDDRYYAIISING